MTAISVLLLICVYLFVAYKTYSLLTDLWLENKSEVGSPIHRHDLESGAFMVSFFVLPISLLLLLQALQKFVWVSCQSCGFSNRTHKNFKKEKRILLRNDTALLGKTCAECTADLSVSIRKHPFFSKIQKAASYDKFMKEHLAEMERTKLDD